MDRACTPLEDKEHNLKRLDQPLNRLTAPSSSPSIVQVVSCLTLLLCTVSATVFAELSKSNDGSYPYNTFVVPCAVEAFKLLVSALTLLVLHARGDSVKVSFSYSNFAMFAIPAFCYFVSNNCMFYIIRELGPTTYQITNNLKVLSTALLMRVFLARKLSWLRWKALLLLVVGSVVAELNGDDGGRVRGSAMGYFFVLFSCFASSTGGVLTEKLLKGKSDARESDSIHWQNIQLYLFGVLFGWFAFVVKNTDHSSKGIFTGFNSAAYAMIMSQTMLGLSVSFVLKYIDNIAKCFVAAVSMLCVALLHTSMHGETIPVRLIVSIVLIFFALEQYNNNA